MILRNHPKKIDCWPPTWSAWHGKGDKIPIGEEPERLVAVEEKDDAIELDVVYMGNKCSGYIFVEDADFREKIFLVLTENIGKSIKDIASLNVGF
ncbi:MAG: hypothetical protein JRJ85_13035 [Deltaproteobacteria bacterium]|nr:hypothetical protein [Deltaproteobacteria bacterium]